MDTQILDPLFQAPIELVGEFSGMKLYASADVPEGEVWLVDGVDLVKRIFNLPPRSEAEPL